MIKQRNSKGFTLVELLLAVGLSSFAGILAISLIFFFSQTAFNIRARIQIEENLLRATWAIQRSLSMAVRLDKIATIGNAEVLDFTNPSTRGKIREFNFTNFGGASGTTQTVAAFMRESGIDDTSATKSRMSAAMISYIHPSPSKSGVIFLNLSNTSGALTPSYGANFYDRVVEFGFKNIQTATYGTGSATDDIAVGVNVRITMRYFPETFRLWNFCPEADIIAATAGCTLAAIKNHTDISREVRVTLFNQVIRQQAARSIGSIFERTLGNIHIFPLGR